MEFFVPDVSANGEKMPPAEAETAWEACFKGALDDMGRDALARRVYRLEYVHNGRSISAVVGGKDTYSGDLIMAIIAFPGVYSIRCRVRGYIKIGEPIMVGEHDVRYVEDFDA